MVMAGGNSCERRAVAMAERLGRLPRARLGLWPTPLHRLERLGASYGTDCLFIKRDDLASVGMGGNKVRSLEYLLGEALCLGCDTVITSGGLQSNLCRLTAAAAAKLGLSCILVHNAAEPEMRQGNMLLSQLAGAEALFVGPVDEAERERICDEVASAARGQGRRPYIVRNGASVARGALGFAAAALELYRQAEQGGPRIEHVAMVGAMGGTAAGFVLGAALLGRPFSVSVISVEYPAAELRRRIESLASGAMALLESVRLPGEEPLTPLPLDDVMVITDDYLGDGYARETAAARAAMLAIARQEGIFVEPIYTAKTLAGCLDLIARGVFGGRPVCFWHTGGTVALFGLAAQLQP